MRTLAIALSLVALGSIGPAANSDTATPPAPAGIDRTGRAGQAPDKPKTVAFHVGTYTNGDSKGIYRLELDTATGRLSATPALAGEAVNPSFLAWHPSKPVLYAVSETSSGPEKQGFVVAFAAGADGKLTKINEQPSGGSGPCYVSVHPDGTHVFVANYGGGSVAALPVRDDGGLEPASSVVKHSGSGAHPKRQRQPYAHSIRAVPGTPFVLAADLGADRVFVYRFEPKGALVAHGQGAPAAAPGSGPRHIAIHPEGNVVFVINELTSTLTTYAWDAGAGTLTAKGTVSTLPEGFTGENTTAEVAVHPTGRFVYGSNRGHDSIAAFRVGESGALTMVGTYPTGGASPRHFAIDPSGEFLLAANQRSDSITVFRIDQQTGALKDTGERAKVPSPVCIRFR